MTTYKIILCLAFCIFLTSCEQKSQKRVYEEITLNSPARSDNMMPEDPHRLLREDPSLRELFANTPAVQPSAGGTISWSVPEGWKELPPSGFRLASFSAQDPSQAIDVSIVKLEGAAGGVKANIVRWMGQLQMTVPSDKEFDVFLSQQEKLKTAQGKTALLIDFQPLQPANAAVGMVAVILEEPDFTLFIKMTGAPEIIQQQMGPFKSLCTSIRIP